MTRQTSLLTGLVLVAVLLAWWFLLMAPRGTEIAALREQTEEARTKQTAVQGQIRALETVRTEAPDIEAELAAARQLLPGQPGLPSAIRQLQDAADQSGLVLASITPSRPTPVVELPELSAIGVAITVEGGYYQWVDFLRRVEDPRLVGRGVLVDAVDLGVADYPSLVGNVQLTMFATTTVTPGADEPTSDADAGGDPALADDAEDDTSTDDEGGEA